MTRDRANAGVVTGRTNGVPEAVWRPATLQVANGAGAVERPDRVAAVLGDNATELGSHRGQRFVPRDAFELRRALGTHPFHWVHEPRWVVAELEIRVHLYAQPAAGVRMIGVAT